jgi:hypothetical protein
LDLSNKSGLFQKNFIFPIKISKNSNFLTIFYEIFSLKLFFFVCNFISYLMVKSVSKKSLPFKSDSKNSECLSKKFLIKMSIFVSQSFECVMNIGLCVMKFFLCVITVIPLNIAIRSFFCSKKFGKNLAKSGQSLEKFSQPMIF